MYNTINRTIISHPPIITLPSIYPMTTHTAKTYTLTHSLQVEHPPTGISLLLATTSPWRHASRRMCASTELLTYNLKVLPRSTSNKSLWAEPEERLHERQTPVSHGPSTWIPPLSRRSLLLLYSTYCPFLTFLPAGGFHQVATQSLPRRPHPYPTAHRQGDKAREERAFRVMLARTFLTFLPFLTCFFSPPGLSACQASEAETSRPE